MAIQTHLSTPLDASKVEFHQTTDPKPSPYLGDDEQLEQPTDHMLTVSWTASKGWDVPKIVPYGPLPLMPSSSVLNYATACYEGIKLYRGFDGRLRLLRPAYNCQRMLQSATRLTLPAFEPEELLKLVHKLCAVEGPKWLPKDKAAGSSLYMRPVMMGTDATVGIKVPRSALLCLFLVYWPGPGVAAGTATATSTPKPEQGSKLLASSDSTVRAFPQGTGGVKIGANYGPSLLEHSRAQKAGYDQILWLFGPDRQITEAGGSNVFIIWTTPAGVMQILTPPLDEDQLVLAGNTRWCVLELAREMFSAERQDGANKCEVLEAKATMQEVQEAAEQGRLESVFVTGTAWQIHPVSVIGFNGKDIEIPVGKVPHVSLLRQKMSSILYGKEESNLVEIVKEEN
ncbi:aminotransferase [Xylariales sp. PMI_506]|nr:aminotransferase [Xylariales sp. PMI_506]